ncbi:DNA-processing protein DprA [Calditrichota bacterium]
MQTSELTNDSKAILLLCGVFRKKSENEGKESLTVREYNLVENWLLTQNLTPASFLEPHVVEAFKEEKDVLINPLRLESLLQRGAELAFAVEKWVNNGIWIVTRSDESYPDILRRRLNHQCPPILYGTGDQSLFDCAGLAVVGSRNVDEAGEEYTMEVGKQCAAEGMAITSGGARGVDNIAMESVLEAGGVAVGVLPNNLLRTSVSGTFRDAIVDRRLLLISSVNPEAGFNVGNAMIRNKYIYALSSYALIISSEAEKGGTWSGAVEELRRKNHIPVFVRMEGNPPEGNIKLRGKGAMSFPPRPWTEPLADKLKSISPPPPPKDDQGDLFAS